MYVCIDQRAEGSLSVAIQYLCRLKLDTSEQSASVEKVIQTFALSRRLPTAQRVLEILPTATVWLIITAPVWAALVAPAAFGFGMIVFSVYWLWKSLSFASGVLIGFWRLHKAQQRDWVAAARVLPGYDQLRHLVIVPTCGENEEIVADTLHYLTAQDVPLDRVNVVLAFEERDPIARTRAARLSARFAPLFQHFLTTYHPDLPGEQTHRVEERGERQHPERRIEGAEGLQDDRGDEPDERE